MVRLFIVVFALAIAVAHCGWLASQPCHPMFLSPLNTDIDVQKTDYCVKRGSSSSIIKRTDANMAVEYLCNDPYCGDCQVWTMYPLNRCVADTPNVPTTNFNMYTYSDSPFNDAQLVAYRRPYFKGVTGWSESGEVLEYVLDGSGVCRPLVSNQWSTYSLGSTRVTCTQADNTWVYSQFNNDGACSTTPRSSVNQIRPGCVNGLAYGQCHNICYF